MPANFKAYDALAKRFADAGRDAPKEIKAAVQASQRSAKTELARTVQTIYAVKAASLKSRLSVTPPDQNKYRITADAKGISVASFGARQDKKGLVYRALKSGPQISIPSGFFPSKGNKAKVPFKRVGKSRLPVAVQYGPSAAEILASDAVKTPVIKAIKTRFDSDIVKRINRITKRGK